MWNTDHPSLKYRTFQKFESDRIIDSVVYYFKVYHDIQYEQDQQEVEYPEQYQRERREYQELEEREKKARKGSVGKLLRELKFWFKCHF